MSIIPSTSAADWPDNGAPGTYIALEGGEGSGKSSVTEAIVSRLTASHVDVVATREPGGTDVGEQIRDVLLHGANMSPMTEVLLFAAGRQELRDQILDRALQAGKWVVSDRTVVSSLVYQGLVRGVGFDRVWEANMVALGSTWPDVVLILDSDPRVALARQQDADRIGGQKLDFHVAVREGYLQFAAMFPDRCVVVNASRSLDELVADVLAVVDRLAAV